MFSLTEVKMVQHMVAVGGTAENKPDPRSL